MSTQSTVPAATETKPGKNQFKCFQCRKIHSNREGDWVNWDSMQVHLCRVCDAATANAVQRSHDKK